MNCVKASGGAQAHSGGAQPVHWVVDHDGHRGLSSAPLLAPRSVVRVTYVDHCGIELHLNDCADVKLSCLCLWR
ncbi:hypothetical protein DIJ64_02555 [Mycobacterium leprae]|uniref:Uncharacterized protein n=1 Tax=Mycobacterium leprae TaxID=1769 RepID=A0AAD0P6B4_MYCLR|nr:hypothetical protein DIJ64_02555 [Mycobacterium leprae]OAR20637.1 hypothetical protein A8144_10135 [Mycobacterium leprae 3125609]OAX70799.1 hypothetical protein A3216_09650 [Mycobacterium leprae 7935681]